jgi:hypothetical protein
MLLLYFSIHMIINRGKFELKYMVMAMAFSLLVGMPVYYFNLYPGKLPLILYIVYYAVLLVPYYIYEFYFCLKGRQSWMRFLLIFIGVNVILMNPFLQGSPKFISLAFGLSFVFGFFVYHFRYPHLNPMWLDDAAKKAAKDIEKDCKYSSKPVIVPIPSKRTSCTGSSGLFLLFKKRHAIVKVKKDFHAKLGSPNMERYAEELVKRIKEKIRGETQEKKGDIK